VHETEELRSAAFEATPTMCVVVDEAGLLVAVNAFGAQSLGYSASELLGQPWLNLFYEPDRNAVRVHAEDCFREVGRVTHWVREKPGGTGRSYRCGKRAAPFS
jgi:PAS domain S-box-containing protein